MLLNEMAAVCRRAATGFTPEVRPLASGVFVSEREAAEIGFQHGFVWQKCAWGIHDRSETSIVSGAGMASP
jgi:hypothetical protein